jgi:hypothetical protein
LLLSAAPLAAGESFQLFPPSVPLQHYFASSVDEDFQPFESEALKSGGSGVDPAAFDMAGGSPPVATSHPTVPHPIIPKLSQKTEMILLTAGVLAGSAASSMWAGHQRQSFNFANEEWFGSGTYAGGADKASHFVFYNGLSRQLGVAYQYLGYERDRASLLSFATSVAAGLIVEVGDGLTAFGFAWEDLAMDTLGAGTALLITHYNLDDTVGFRFGKMSAEQPPPCCRTSGIGKDYSEEIYTADLKLGGFARRLQVRPGPARYLLFSVSYDSKGYRYSPPEFRERNIGLELGLNIPEIMAAVGVPENKWWGRILYAVFNFVRLPFTSIGVYYDLNHGRWNGPNNGNVYNPGP